ncbi:MAG: geranylgeranylglyceryl/heptaprenylglyceryl phosphate synthase [Bacteroidetes bacterium]|nr:MAG: geranylgeranylglyceryl/heptaprenylglyceryl phosphate synthase [Bacteroidota bacterium]
MVRQLSNTSAKELALLIDPDKFDADTFSYLTDNGLEQIFSYIFVGGSLFIENRLDETVRKIKSLSTLPVILFPGSSMHISPYADGVLFLSLISGRNPEYLIGNQVLAAPKIKQSNLTVFPTGYLLIDGGITTTAHYVSNTQPIPRHKPEIAAVTAMAAELMGMKNIYLDCGSGAVKTIPEKMIQEVKANTNLPLIIGGGIASVEKIHQLFYAGANVLVLGNVIEKNNSFIQELKNLEIPNGANRNFTSVKLS